MKKYLYVHVKMYDFETSWDYRYLSDEDIYKKGDYVWVQVEDVEIPAIVTKSVWYDEDNVPWPLEKMKSIIRRSSREEYLKHNEWSVLNYILSRLDKNSKLPDDFTLNQFKNEEIKFVDGAMDGIFFFHTDGEEDTNLTEKLCKLISDKKEDYIEAVEIFDKAIVENHVRPSLNSINEYVIKHSEELTNEYIYTLAHTMMYRSKNPEVVKLGIVLISNYDIAKIDKELYYVFNKLVLCNEFSDLIGLCIYPNYKNTNKLRFEAAKKVTGWGRIFLIFQIDFDTEEKKEWLLNEGYENDIAYGYTATYILSQIDALKILKDKNITKKTFENISWIISESIFPGPGVSIDRIDNYKEIFDAYLDLKDKFSSEWQFYSTAKNMYAFESEKYVKALNALDTEECHKIVVDKMTNGTKNEAYNVVDICKVSKKYDYKDIVLNRFNKDPFDNAFCIDFLMLNEETKEDLIKRLNSGSDLVEGLSVDDEQYKDFLYELEYYPLVGLPYVYEAFKIGSEAIEGQAEWLINRWNAQKAKIPKDLEKYIEVEEEEE